MKADYFKNELSLIQDTELKTAIIEFFETCVPNYFWTMPASSTGKYHPDQDAGSEGLLRHTRMVTQVAISMLQLEMWSTLKPFSDEILCACLIHDSFKLGDAVQEYVEKQTYTHFEHPVIASHKFYEFIQAYPNATDKMKVQCQKICQAVETHMGQWNTPKFGNAILRKPGLPIEKFVHLCDFIASRNFIGTLDKIDGK